MFELLRRTLRPEFLNRIDEVIVFKPLQKSEMRGILRLQLQEVERLLAKQNLQLEVTDEALDWLADYGYDPQFGARPLKRLIQREIVNALSKQILSGKLLPEKPVVVDAIDGALRFYTKQTVV